MEKKIWQEGYIPRFVMEINVVKRFRKLGIVENSDFNYGLDEMFNEFISRKFESDYSIF